MEVLSPLAAALDAPPGAAVLVAPPGAGKTTVVPLWLLDRPWMAGLRVLLLEPRRLAARAAARRMAELVGDEVGGVVGYQTRDERVIGPRTRVEVLTEGVLTRRLQHQPELDGVGAVVFDEVHERNLPTDLGLALALDVRGTIRPDLRLVAMSATPDAGRLAKLLGWGAPAAVVASDGRQHPVEVRWRPRAPMPARRGGRASGDVLDDVADTVEAALRDEPGDVLVFLPGIAEIRRVADRLRGRVPPTVDVRQLAGALPLAEQDLALQPSPAGRRRVVLSTDIAESSLTVAGIRVVVDAGLARVPRFDARSGMTRLTTVTTSRASADQRAGRAGRTEPGVCYRLWSQLEQSTRTAHLPAEITQVDLAGLVLELAAWRARPDDLAFIDPPPGAALRAAGALLRELGALDAAGSITGTGRRMLDLPLHPRLARMVVDAPDGLRYLACHVAALLDERDVLRGRPDELPADLAHRVRVLAGHRHDDRADRRAVERAHDRAADVARRARVARVDVDADRAGAVLALAFPDRLAARRQGDRREPAGRGRTVQFQLRSGGGAWVGADDPLAGEAFVVAADLDGNRTSARIRSGAGLDAADVEAAFADEVERTEDLRWDKGRDDLVVHTRVRLGGMTLREEVAGAPPGPATTAALVERVRATRLAALGIDRAADLRARVDFVRRHHAEAAAGWPDLGDRALVATLDEWLGPHLAGATGRADLERLDPSLLLAGLLGWDRSLVLAEEAPPTLATPTGRSVPIDYTRDPPVAAVRVQDLFGTTTHPTLAGGRVPLVLELLSPADRPLQVTSDLPGFWSGSWAAVRKEMAGRYPKHHWPVDPAAAAPKRLKDR